MKSQMPNRTPDTQHAPWYPLFLWTILVLVVFGFCMLNSLGSKKKHMHVGDPARQTVASPEMVLMGRYFMGAKSLFSNVPSLEAQSISAGMLAQLKNSIRLTTDQVGLVPFIVEFEGRQEAFDYMDGLRNSAELKPSHRSDLDHFEALYRSGLQALSHDKQRQLVARYRWIAQLAMTTGLTEDHPERRLVMKLAMRTFITALLVFGLITMGGLTGCTLFILFIVMWVKKRIRFVFNLLRGPSPHKPYVYLEATLLFLTMTLLSGLLGRYIQLPGNWVFTLLGAVAAFFWPVWRGMSIRGMRRAVGWHKGRGVLREMGAGLVGYLAGLPLVACGCLATFYIIKHTGANPVHPIVQQFEHATILRVIGMVVLACIAAPVIEEAIFRGALYSHLRLKHSALWSALVSSFLFAVIHPQGYAALPTLGAIAMVLAILREWRGALIAPMTAHALNNFLATMMLAFALSG